MTDDEYSADSDLFKIANWSDYDWAAWLDAAVSAWNHDMGTASRDGNLWTFVTGGWSGNEDVIYAMKECNIGWMMTWHSSFRGGRFVFEVRK